MTAPGLYVHIPFCRSRCGYCTFASGIYDREKASAYLDALEQELLEKTALFRRAPPSTVFIGGGTPSSLSAEQMRRLLGILPRPSGEMTCELNPDSVDRDLLSLLLDQGVNRLSFGVQTFSPEGLRLLGRRHDAVQASLAVEQAHSLGFSRISIDLINGWPGQSPRLLEQDLLQAVHLGVGHISCYNLILEPTAPAYSTLARLRESEEKEEERGREMWDLCEALLESAGYRHYETSNFARPGAECCHNLAIWKGGEYAGVGMAAHSFLGGRRFANTGDFERYLASAGQPSEREVFSERLSPKDAARECSLFWLRLFDGIGLEEFQERTGWDFRLLHGDRLPALLQQGMLEYAHGGSHIRVPKHYQPLLDSILVELL